MSKAPLILVSADVEAAGVEFGDRSLSLSEKYPQALFHAGALPFIMPPATTRGVIAECVSRCDGVLLTGGEDMNPDFYAPRLPRQLRETVSVTPDGGARDLRELLVVDEVFRQRKPLLAI